MPTLPPPSLTSTAEFKIECLPQCQATVFEELGHFSVLGSLSMNTENMECKGPLILKGDMF